MKIRIYPKSLLETMWQQDKLLFTPEAEQPPLCLRCGQPLDCRLVINALSRYADVHICEACGMDEALRDANRCPLPLTEWAAVTPKGVLPGVSEREAALEETAGERTALLPEKAEDEAGFERADDADTA